MSWGRAEPEPSVFRYVDIVAPTSDQLSGLEGLLRLSLQKFICADSYLRFRKLIPVFLVLVVAGAVGWIGYQVYLVTQQIGNTAQEKINKKMDKKNVVFTKDGMRVGVKHMQDEKYVGKTQKWAVKAWNLAESTEDPDLKKQKKK